MAIVRKEKFIFVESAENHNKFWYIEEHDNGLIKTTWGRVGNKETTSEKQFGGNAGKEYDKLVKSKLKKGYTKLNTVDSTISLNKKGGLSNQSLEAIALEEIEYDKSNKTIVDMIKHFCNSNIHDITAHTAITFNASTNMFQTPCGVVTLDSINNARNILNKIFDYVLNHDYCYDYVKQSEEYCKLIPQKIRGKFDARKLFNTKYDVENQNNLLDALENSIKLIEDLEKNSDNKVKLFNTSIAEVTDNKVIDDIKALYNKTHNSIHACRDLKVKRVFEIKIDKMHNNYNETREKWIADKKRKSTMQLWHGTKATNIISIMKNGFVIPPANASHCTGRMFGSDGVYMSDQSTKSLNYAYGYWGGSRDKNCYMFLCDAMLGTAYVPSGSCSKTPAGYDSIFAKAKTSGVQNNEMVVPLNQVNPKYLIEFGE